MENSQYTQNIQIKYGRSFGPALTCDFHKSLLDYISMCNLLLSHDENVSFLATHCNKWWKMDTLQST